MKRIQILSIILILSMLTGSAFADVTAGFNNNLKKDFWDALLTKVLRIALYVRANTTLAPTTTVYDSTGEVTAFATYSTGGKVLTGCASSLVGNRAKITCNNPVWPNSTITSDAASVYAEDWPTAGVKRVLGSFTYTSAASSGGDFTVTIPTDLLYLE